MPHQLYIRLLQRLRRALAPRPGGRGQPTVSKGERSGGEASSKGTLKRSARRVAGQGAKRRSNGPRSAATRVRKTRRLSEARGSGAPENVSAMPTTDQDFHERSDMENAGLCHVPLCPFSLSLASGASAEDRGHIADVISEKGWFHIIWYPTGIRRTRRAVGYQGHPFSLESRGSSGSSV